MVRMYVCLFALHLLFGCILLFDGSSAWASAQGGAVLRHMWATPIQVANLVGGSSNAPATNHREISMEKSLLGRMQEVILASFDSFCSNQTLFHSYERELADGSSASDAFFFYQRDLHQREKSHCLDVDMLKGSEMQQQQQQQQQQCTESGADVGVESTLATMYNTFLYKYVRPMIDSFLRENYIETGALPSVNASNTFVWASVHANGTSHRPHHHYGSLLSGVFYIDVPPKSGMHACMHVCMCLKIYEYSESIYI
jgi:hypothetical protein